MVDSLTSTMAADYPNFKKLWKHHVAYLEGNDMLGRMTLNHCKPRNNTKFEIGEALMVKNHAHHVFKPKYLMEYQSAANT